MASTPHELNEKFGLEHGTFQLSFGGLETFYGGLEAMIGPPLMVKASSEAEALSLIHISEPTRPY